MGVLRASSGGSLPACAVALGARLADMAGAPVDRGKIGVVRASALGERNHVIDLISAWSTAHVAHSSVTSKDPLPCRSPLGGRCARVALPRHGDNGVIGAGRWNPKGTTRRCRTSMSTAPFTSTSWATTGLGSTSTSTGGASIGAGTSSHHHASGSHPRQGGGARKAGAGGSRCVKPCPTTESGDHWV